MKNIIEAALWLAGTLCALLLGVASRLFPLQTTRLVKKKQRMPTVKKLKSTDLFMPIQTTMASSFITLAQAAARWYRNAAWVS